MKVLVIAAHPDDEVLGCGATSARLVSEGHEVHFAILGEGMTSRHPQRSDVDARQLALLSERAHAAVEIGRLKRDTDLPIYEPERERIVFENVQAMNRGPLPGRDLVRIFERIMDVMRNIQKEGARGKAAGAKAETELDSEVND